MKHKITLLTLSLLVSHTSLGAETFTVQGQPATKVEALKALINDPDTAVTRCQDVTISPKATIVVKKIKKAKGE